jgi:hypothetical protein
MFTANDVKQKVQDFTVEQCERIDDWLRDELTYKFVTSAGSKVSVTDSRISSLGWNKNIFIKAMEVRGFSVEYYCEDRPCGQCYYMISLVGEV